MLGQKRNDRPTGTEMFDIVFIPFWRLEVDDTACFGDTHFPENGFGGNEDGELSCTEVFERPQAKFGFLVSMQGIGDEFVSVQFGSQRVDRVPGADDEESGAQGGLAAQKSDQQVGFLVFENFVE